MRNIVQRYKICYQTRLDLWLMPRILKLKKKKWRQPRRIRNPYTLYNRKSSAHFYSNINSPFILVSGNTMYKQRLLDRQILKNFYGGISERYFRIRYLKNRTGSCIDKKIFKLFELRLDIILVRLLLASSIFVAQTYIKNGHILVNNKEIKCYNTMLYLKDFVRFRRDWFKAEILIVHVKKRSRIILVKQKQRYFARYRSYILRPAHLEQTKYLLGGFVSQYPDISTLYFPKRFRRDYLAAVYSI